MLITWIDQKSVLKCGKKSFQAGDVVPAGMIPENRLEHFVFKKQIRLGEIVVDKSIKKTVAFGMEVSSTITGEVKDDKPKRGRPSKEANE
jgi:hypothetical protein